MSAPDDGSSSQGTAVEGGNKFFLDLYRLFAYSSKLFKNELDGEIICMLLSRQAASSTR
jgi:hypothetical protein